MKLDVYNRRGERAVQLQTAPPPRCSDFDEDCKTIGATDKGFRSHLECFLYDPQRGACPYLSKP